MCITLTLLHVTPLCIGKAGDLTTHSWLHSSIVIFIFFCCCFSNLVFFFFLGYYMGNRTTKTAVWAK